MFTLKVVDDVPAVPVVEPTKEEKLKDAVAPAVVDSTLADVLKRVEAMQAKQDALLNPEVQIPKAPEIPTIDPTSFLLEPDKYVAQVVSATMQRQEWERAEMNRKAQSATAAVTAVVPDALEVYKDAGFTSFLESNKAAKGLYENGVKSMEPDGVILALQLYKAMGGSSTEDKVDTAVDVTAAGSGSGVAPIAPSTFSRAALDKLQVQDPDRYAAMSYEILAAYASGRITS